MLSVHGAQRSSFGEVEGGGAGDTLGYSNWAWSSYWKHIMAARVAIGILRVCCVLQCPQRHEAGEFGFILMSDNVQM